MTSRAMAVGCECYRWTQSPRRRLRTGTRAVFLCGLEICGYQHGERASSSP